MLRETLSMYVCTVATHTCIVCKQGPTYMHTTGIYRDEGSVCMYTILIGGDIKETISYVSLRYPDVTVD